MLCHSRIIIHYPEIEKVRRHYEQKASRSGGSGSPICRTSPISTTACTLPPASIAANATATSKAMDRIVLAPKFTMGFCIQCHRENNATRDCFTCHY